MKKISRRKFFKLALGTTGAFVISCQVSESPLNVLGKPQVTPSVYIPLVKNGSAVPPTATATLRPTVPGPTPSTPIATQVNPTATPLRPTTAPTTAPTNSISAPIIADHTVVDKYSQIPQQYIDLVKKMWVDIPGESHSLGYRIGCQLLQNENGKFAVNIQDDGNPEGTTDQHMRLNGATWGDVDHASGWLYHYGEEDWYTTPAAIQRTKNHLTYCHTNQLPIAAFGFAWCWDMTWRNSPDGTMDPVYKVRWAGSSDGGPDGNKIWGLDAADYSLTGNHVCMDTYLQATADYIAHCQAHQYPTKVFFTTGPVDLGSENIGESGYQRHLKHEHIRNYVKASNGLYLFDYADILCWSNANQQKTTSWTDGGGTVQVFPYIHDDNTKDLNGNVNEDSGHIGQRGALRLAKALWWLLARFAGWNGS